MKMWIASLRLAKTDGVDWLSTQAGRAVAHKNGHYGVLEKTSSSRVRKRGWESPVDFRKRLPAILKK